MSREKCLSCDGNKLQRIFDFGALPPVNTFYQKGQEPEKNQKKLVLNVCNSCWLIQLDDTHQHSEMFQAYHHFSSASADNVRHLKSVSETLEMLFTEKGSFEERKVLEVGCNDCTLLDFLKEKGWNCVGVDPGENFFPKTTHHVYKTFFNNNLVSQLSADKGHFDFIVGLNVFAHNDTFIEMFQAAKKLLKQNGVFFIEVAYAPSTILTGNYDTIYHEHVCSYSLHSLKYALELAGLKVFDADLIPTQGGSLRVFASHEISSFQETTRLDKILQKESLIGVLEPNFYNDLNITIAKKIADIDLFIKTCNERNKRVLLVGAPARGIVTLTVAKEKFATKVIAVDDTKAKQGRLMPGLGIPVISWNDLKIDQFDTALILSWNYVDTLIKRLSDLSFRGDVYLPFPNFERVNVGIKSSS